MSKLPNPNKNLGVKFAALSTLAYPFVTAFSKLNDGSGQEMTPAGCFGLFFVFAIGFGFFIAGVRSDLFKHK